MGIVGVDRNRITNPSLKDSSKCFGLERHEQTSNAVPGGDAVGRDEIQSRPGFSVPGPLMDGGGFIAVTDDAGDRNDGDIDQRVLPIECMTGIRARLEVGTDRSHVDKLGNETRS